MHTQLHSRMDECEDCEAFVKEKEDEILEMACSLLHPKREV